MSSGEPGPREERLPEPVAAALAPIDRRAFGAAVGTVSALALLVLTGAELLRPPGPGPNLSLLEQFFPGYSVSPVGALVGLAWGFAVGFCAGWFVALIRNLGIAAWILAVRARQELAATRDLLDRF